MKLHLAVLIGTVAMLGTSTAAFAAGTTNEQINSAIAKGDFETVASLANASSASAGFAVKELLRNAENGLQTDKQGATAAMNAAVAIGPQINAADAASVATSIRTTAHAISHPANGNASRPHDATAASVFNSILALAQMPAIVTADPALYGDLVADSSDYVNLLLVELAQDPGFRSNSNSFRNLHVFEQGNTNNTGNANNMAGQTQSNQNTASNQNPPSNQSGSGSNGDNPPSSITPPPSNPPQNEQASAD